jgi:cell division inhibitor SepF
MGLFSFFKKKEEEQDTPLKRDLIYFELLENGEDETLVSIANKIVAGNPSIINLEKLDIDDANKAIAFLSGVCYGISGEIVNVKEKIFMFSDKTVYDDGSMESFLKEIVE